ncbi:hypothetical protein, partial [Thalassolituus sp.]|uniref:hypothetical protein n=1 Tax=Thalassolituus sp. TaxID=2030822 RepID=UPI003512CCB1
CTSEALVSFLDAIAKTKSPIYSIQLMLAPSAPGPNFLHRLVSCTTLATIARYCIAWVSKNKTPLSTFRKVSSSDTYPESTLLDGLIHTSNDVGHQRFGESSRQSELSLTDEQHPQALKHFILGSETTN